MLQHDSQLRLIRQSLERKIKNELTSWMKNDREKYDAFFENFGLQLKIGCYDGYGMHKDALQDLLLFRSMKQDKLVSLAEYVEAMPEEQKYIYYASAESVQAASRLPAAELISDKGFDLLVLTQDVDEFVLQVLHTYKEKEFRNVSGGDLGLETEEEKKENEAKSAEYKDLFAAMKTALGDKVSDVRLSSRLKTHPVCLSSEGALSIEMEKVLNAMPTGEKVASRKVLELNGDHEVFAALKAAFDAGDMEKVNAYSDILYTQARLIEGLAPEDPVAYANAVCKLMK